MPAKTKPATKNPSARKAKSNPAPAKPQPEQVKVATKPTTTTPTTTAKKGAEPYALDARIAIIKPNPHRAGTKDAKLFANLKDKMTVADAVQKVRQFDLRWWATRGAIEIVR